MKMMPSLTKDTIIEIRKDKVDHRDICKLQQWFKGRRCGEGGGVYSAKGSRISTEKHGRLYSER